MKKNKLEKKVQELGFELRTGLATYINEFEGWDLSRFRKKEEKDELIELCLDIRRHEKYGINIALFSMPWEKTYHFATGSPVNEEEALRLIKGYLQAVKKGKKYKGK